MSKIQEKGDQVDKSIGLCLSGGGSRAVAFHLGCFRALHALGLLSHVRVISAVSGGSVIAALYAYTDGDFETFDKRVVEFLTRGLARDSLCHWVCSGRIFLNLFFVLLIIANHAVGFVLSFIFGKSHIRYVRRRFSRTDSIAHTLKEYWFGERELSDVVRKNLEVIFNACELQTYSAFRFGSREVRNHKFGRVLNAVGVAEAVTASAAYPAMLPALDRIYSFQQDGHSKAKRVILTDGGVYENLGVTPLFPDRDPKFSLQVTPCEIIIACDAGMGSPRGGAHHQWILPRLTECFSSVMRRVQSASFAKLHELVLQKQIKSFVLAFLGQDDKRLPNPPEHLIPREKVIDYPTDFYAMSIEDIQMLSKRGEQITLLLAREYLLKKQGIMKG